MCWQGKSSVLLSSVSLELFLQAQTLKLGGVSTQYTTITTTSFTMMLLMMMRFSSSNSIHHSSSQSMNHYQGSCLYYTGNMINIIMKSFFSQISVSIFLWAMRPTTHEGGFEYKLESVLKERISNKITLFVDFLTNWETAHTAPELSVRFNSMNQHFWAQNIKTYNKNNKECHFAKSSFINNNSYQLASTNFQMIFSFLSYR